MTRCPLLRMVAPFRPALTSPPPACANAGIPTFKPSSFDLYGPARVPLVTDVQQGALGDCWLMAALADVAYIDPGAIERMFNNNGNGTYTVGLYTTQMINGVSVQPGPIEYVTVDRRALPAGGWNFDNPYVGSAYGSPFVVLWAALAEKAYAELYCGNSYQNMAGGFSNVPLAAITGRPTPPDISPDHTDLANALEQDQFVCLATPGSVPVPLIHSHEYAVLNYDKTSAHFLAVQPLGDQRTRQRGRRHPGQAC